MRIAATAALVTLVACGGSTAQAPPPPGMFPSDDAIAGLSDADLASFDAGKAAFAYMWTEPDGLGPLYIAASCRGCHQDGVRGPGIVEKMVMVDADGYTTAMDQSALPWGHTIRRGLAAGAVTPILAPNVPGVRLSTRIGPQMLGRGYLEAIASSEIRRMQTEQAARTDAIHGTINLVSFDAIPNPDTTFESYKTGDTNLVGRFGLKARRATLDDYIADALQGSTGMTSPMEPVELTNPDNLTDDRKPGVDLTIEDIDTVVFYMRRIAIPRRDNLPADGPMLFDQALCSVCHVPSLHTRADYPIAELAGIDAPVFSDLLLHDMGAPLADGLTDQNATSTQWRTPPLVGVRFAGMYLHDGRAATVTDAIVAHTGEAAGAAAAFAAMSAADQQALINYVQGL